MVHKFSATPIFQTSFSANLPFQRLFLVLGCGQQFKRERMTLWQYFGSEGGKPLLLVTLSSVQVLAWHKGTMYSAEFLDRILFATRFTRRLDKNGYLRFQNWKLYGERGLAKAPVTVWIYECSLKVEHQAVTLSRYSVELQDDHKHLQVVSHPRLADTPFRSPQLASARRRRRVAGIMQLPLFDPEPIDLAMGADEGRDAPHPRSHLQLVEKPPSDQ
jgi:hypothetical protein